MSHNYICAYCNASFKSKNIRPSKSGNRYCSPGHAAKHRANLNRRSPEERFWEKVDKTPGLGPNGDCWVWTKAKTSSSKNYGQFYYDGDHILATHFAWFLKTGHLPSYKNKEIILHDCDYPPCVRHIRIGTHQDNIDDMMAKGRNSKGSKSGLSKLNEESVFVIKFLQEKYKVPDEYLAKAFQVWPRTIRRIRRGSTWGHVPKIIWGPIDSSLPQ